MITTEPKVRDHGLLMSAPMVLALLANRKTMTRRLVKPVPGYGARALSWGIVVGDGEHITIHNAPMRVGDTFYVKETWGVFDGGSMFGAVGEPTLFEQDYAVAYKADDTPTSEGAVTWFKRPAGEKQLAVDEKWRSPLFMPRWATRIRRRIVEVRAERVGDIIEEDAIAEGVERVGEGYVWRNYDSPDMPLGFARTSFSTLWDSLHKEPGTRFADSPWTWTYRFEPVE